MFEGKKPFIIRSNFNQNTEIKQYILRIAKPFKYAKI